MNLQLMWTLQGTLFLMVVMGIFLRKKGVLTENAKGVLTELVLNFILPCNIISSFRIEFNLGILTKFIVIIMIGILGQVLCYIICLFAFNRYETGRRKVFKYGTLVSNAGFLGNPIAGGIFGDMGLMYSAIYCIPTRIAMWSVGLALFTDETDKKTAFKKVALHPCMIALYIGAFLMVTGLKLPAFVENTIDSVGRSTTSLTMLLIGCIIAEVEDLKTMINKDVVYFTIIRLVIIPGAIFIGCRLAGIDNIITGVAVLLSGMPAGSTTAILAAKYDGDYVFGTKLVVFSTIMTVLSVPIWSMILG
jgi:malate permease and related proteins